MKLPVTISVLFAVLLALTSCEKVIEVKLNDASKKYVIEANITNQPGDCVVKITQSKSFSGDNNFQGISGATVTMSDNGSAPVTLTENSQGNYQTTTLTGIPGHAYSLNVQIGGQAFNASSIMPGIVTLDSLFSEDRILFGDSSKIINVVYQDPPAKGNAYHFILYKNNVQEKTVFVTNDDYTNGNIVTNKLLFFGNNDNAKLKAGDSVRVIMECIDPFIYKYWFSIDGATGESNNATPANPVSNITGGALGYFSAHTTQNKTVVVK
ncbi:MAG: DUF4249 domain-containing protein [Bacteroidota bacterium]